MQNKNSVYFHPGHKQPSQVQPILSAEAFLVHYTTASVRVPFYFAPVNVQKTREGDPSQGVSGQRLARHMRQRSAGLEAQTETHSSCLWRTLSRTLAGRPGSKQSRSAANTLGTKCKYGRNKEPCSGPPCLLLMLNRWSCFGLPAARLLGKSASPLPRRLSRCANSCLSVALSPAAKQTQSGGNRGALPPVSHPSADP